MKYEDLKIGMKYNLKFLGDKDVVTLEWIERTNYDEVDIAIRFKSGIGSVYSNVKLYNFEEVKEIEYVYEYAIKDTGSVWKIYESLRELKDIPIGAKLLRKFNSETMELVEK